MILTRLMDFAIARPETVFTNCDMFVVSKNQKILIQLDVKYTYCTLRNL